MTSQPLKVAHPHVATGKFAPFWQGFFLTVREHGTPAERRPLMACPAAVLATSDEAPFILGRAVTIDSLHGGPRRGDIVNQMSEPDRYPRRTNGPGCLRIVICMAVRHALR